MIARKIPLLFALFLCSFYCVTVHALPNWITVNQGITNNAGNVSSIAFNPMNNNHVLATADKDGLYQSENGGRTWQRMNNPMLGGNDFVRVSFHPSNSNIIYLGIRKGLLQSINRGKTWNLVKKPQNILYWFEINKQNPNEIYTAETGYYSGGVFKSIDGGKSWKKITEHLEDEFSYYYRRIIIDPYNSNHLYLLVEDDFTSKIYETYDEGANWNRIIGSKSNHHDDPCLFDVEFGTTPGTIYVSGTEGFFKSTDYGKTWTPLFLKISKGDTFISSFLTNPKNQKEFYLYVTTEGIYHTIDNGVHWELTHPAFIGKLLHEPSIKLISNPDHTIIFVSGETFGFFSSMDGKIFTPAGNGMENIEITALAVDRTKSNRHYVGIKNRGLWISDNGIWQFADNQFINTNIQSILIDRSHPAHVIINVNTDTTGNTDITNVYTSDDYGKTWQKATAEKNIKTNTFSPVTLIMNPAKPTELFATSYLTNLIWKSIDGGRHWYYFNNCIYVAANPSLQEKFAINPKNPLEMYMGSDSSTGHLMHKSIDGGKTWALLSFRFGPNVDQWPGNYTQALAIDPVAPKIIYAAIFTRLSDSVDESNLFKTSDGGIIWRKIGEDLPKVDKIYDLVIDEQDHNRIYLATANGIFISTNGGSNWQTFNGELPNLNVAYLAQNQNKLFAGTVASGIFMTDKNESLIKNNIAD